jgi:hypothetical protein
VGIVLSEQIENTYLIEFSNVENTQNAANVELQVRIRYVSRSAVMRSRVFEGQAGNITGCFIKLKRSLSKNRPDSDKEFLKPLLHGNTQQASVWVIGPS